MAETTPALDRAALLQVRRIVRAMRDAEGRGIPRAELLRLAEELGHTAGVTIDFEAAEELGQPLVVLRPVAPRPAACLAALSPRELEVAQLLGQGLSNKDIASRLGISLPTVKDHVHRILDKTGLPSRLAVMAAYILGDQPSGRQA
jgi:DNA-binding NarL/FixJ family response regulator